MNIDNSVDVDIIAGGKPKPGGRKHVVHTNTQWFNVT